MVRYWLSVFKIPYNVLFPCILFFVCIGTFSVNNSLEDILVTATFGFLGYVFLRLELDPAPLMLGFILGPMLEENFRRALLLSRGSFATFVTRPISGTLFGLIALFVVWQLIAFFLKPKAGDVPHASEDEAAEEAALANQKAPTGAASR
jgi:TctA family transporter